MAIVCNINYEVTDTFAGEANYAWVKRGTIKGKEGESFSDLAAVRRVKREIGWSGIRCKTAVFGDMIEIRPYSLNAVCFITFHEYGSCKR